MIYRLIQKCARSTLVIVMGIALVSQVSASQADPDDMTGAQTVQCLLEAFEDADSAEVGRIDEKTFIGLLKEIQAVGNDEEARKKYSRVYEYYVTDSSAGFEYKEVFENLRITLEENDKQCASGKEWKASDVFGYFLNGMPRMDAIKLFQEWRKLFCRNMLKGLSKRDSDVREKLKHIRESESGSEEKRRLAELLKERNRLQRLKERYTDEMKQLLHCSFVNLDDFDFDNYWKQKRNAFQQLRDEYESYCWLMNNVRDYDRAEAVGVIRLYHKYKAAIDAELGPMDLRIELSDL